MTDQFLAALGKRKELEGLFAFFATNLSLVVGNTSEQGFVRFGQFFKVYVQASLDFRRFLEDLDSMFVKNEHGEMVPYSAFLKIEKKQGLNEINRCNLYQTAIVQGRQADRYRDWNHGDTGAVLPVRQDRRRTEINQG